MIVAGGTSSIASSTLGHSTSATSATFDSLPDASETSIGTHQADDDSYVQGYVAGDTAGETKDKTTTLSTIPITGSGKDQDGTFNIAHGKVSSKTGKCYWVEESVSPSSKSPQTVVLVIGVLARDAEAGSVTFSGEWKSNFGSRGSYTRFDIVPKQTLAASEE